MYRQELNGFVPFELIDDKFHMYLSLSLTDDEGNTYTSNQSIENLLSNTKLMKSIRRELIADTEELVALRNTALVDDDASTKRHFSRPSKERDYE